MESNAESAETCHRKVATSTLKVATSSQKMATSMLKVASDIYKLPTPLRTPQTSGHSSSRISNLPLWSLKSPPSHGSKIIIFYLSQSKCTVFALFLHGFKGCNGHSDLQNTTKGAEIAGQKITMLCTKMT